MFNNNFNGNNDDFNQNNRCCPKVVFALLPGTTSPTGPTGGKSPVTINGYYNTLIELTTARPTGNPGEAYAVGTSVYVWNSNTNSWRETSVVVGPTGPQGLQGEIGPTGPTGETPSLTIGTVTTGDPGTEASASITGTAPNYILNLTIPQGPTGPIA